MTQFNGDSMDKVKWTYSWLHSIGPSQGTVCVERNIWALQVELRSAARREKVPSGRPLLIQTYFRFSPSETSTWIYLNNACHVRTPAPSTIMLIFSEQLWESGLDPHSSHNLTHPIEKEEVEENPTMNGIHCSCCHTLDGYMLCTRVFSHCLKQRDMLHSNTNVTYVDPYVLHRMYRPFAIPWAQLSYVWYMC